MWRAGSSYTSTNSDHCSSDIPVQSHCDCGENRACRQVFWGYFYFSFKSICEQCDCHAEARRCSDVYGVICSTLINWHLQLPLLPVKCGYKIELFDLSATEVCLHTAEDAHYPICFPQTLHQVGCFKVTDQTPWIAPQTALEASSCFVPACKNLT